MPGNFGAFMPTGIDKCTNVSLAVAHYQHRRTANMRCKPIVALFDLRFVAQIRPGFLEDIGHFQLENGRVRINAFVDPENTLTRAVIYTMTKIGIAHDPTLQATLGVVWRVRMLFSILIMESTTLGITPFSEQMSGHQPGGCQGQDRPHHMSAAEAFTH